MPPAHDTTSNDVFLTPSGKRIFTAFVNVILVLVAIAGIFFHGVIKAPIGPPNNLSIVLILGLALLVRIALWRQHIRFAVEFLIWGLLGITSYQCVVVAGLHTPSALLFPTLLVVAGVLLERKQALWFSLGTLLCVTVIGCLDLLQLLPSVPRSTEIIFITQITILGLAACFSLMVAAQMRSDYQALRASHQALAQENAERSRAEAALQVLNAVLEERVDERTHTLMDTLSQLKMTQTELIQAEKMASLGTMVAGVSHELNTPIGTIVTLSSTLHDKAESLQEDLEQGQLRKSSLGHYVQDNTEISGMILRSALRAAELIRSFKQVGMDQVSERRRSFDLRALIDDSLSTQHNTLKQGPCPVSLDWEVEMGIQCDSFPGPLIQIISHLVHNAVIHAFHGYEQGHIELLGTLHDGNQVQIIVSDNGKGIDPQMLHKIFDPFFTTQLARGSAGIGLAVCHRIANTVLGGSLAVESTPGAGTQFILLFPTLAPGRA